MNPSDNKRKEEILASAIRSFPIYEVQQICFESHRYPRRRIRLQRVGLFQTKEGAKEAMLAYIKQEKDHYDKWGGDYYTDCLGYYINEVLVHNRYSDFYDGECPQRCNSYTADGELNDCAAPDEFGWFKGRKTKDIRFKKGDIVEFISFDHSELGIVSAPPPSKEDYKRLEKRAMELYPNIPFFMDESDDCFLIYTLGEGDTHQHIVCYKVFHPSKPVPNQIARKLQEKLEEMK